MAVNLTVSDVLSADVRHDEEDSLSMSLTAWIFQRLLVEVDFSRWWWDVEKGLWKEN